MALLLPLLLGLLAGESAHQVKKLAPLVLPADFGRRRMANMRAVVGYLPALLVHRNIKAFLRVIREGESGQDEIDYRRMNGGEKFAAPPWAHPGKVFRPGTTDAAGAYQIRGFVWQEVSKAMGLKDFSPENQDRAAIGRMAYRGALPAVLAGDLKAACAALRAEWTSLPGGKEAKKLTPALAAVVFTKYGGGG